MKLPIFRWQLEPEDKNFLFGCFEEILNEAYLTNHTYARKLEELAKETLHFTGSSFAVNNGTSAIELSLRASLTTRKEVLIQNNTFIASAIAALRAGSSNIKFIDNENSRSPWLSFDDLKENVSSQTGAIVIVHIAGFIHPDIDAIKSFCQERNIALIEDAAQAWGAKLGDHFVGSWGDWSAFSLHLTKVVSGGEGGLVFCHSKSLAEKIKSLRQFGMSTSSTLLHDSEGGMNAKITEFAAALAYLDIKRAPVRIAKRRALALRYQENLRNSSWVCLGEEKNQFSTFYKQVVFFPEKINRESLSIVLLEKGISLTGGVYFNPLHKQPVLRSYVGNCSFSASEAFSQHICPPCYPEMTLEEVDFVCNALLEITNEKGNLK